MAQLLVRNLPDEVKDRLQRRAARHGRSLEAEVRDILAQAPEVEASGNKRIGTGTLLVRKLAKHKVDDADWHALEDNMKVLRKNWRVRDVDLDT
ncbi:MAG: Arc family DNA-binding protein [Hyphomicrobium sp.]